MVLFTRKEEVVENFHGTDIRDPYRWLEQPENPEVQQWVDEQNSQTQKFIATFPHREKMKQKLTKTWNYPKYTVPRKEGDYYYFHKNDGLQNQAVFYRTKDLQSEELEVILDPNTMNDEGTAAITNLAFSKDGKRLAYGISFNGSDWQEIKVRNLESGKDEEDLIQFCKFSSIAWNEEGTGFYYNRFPDPSTVQPEEQSFYNKVYWHEVGTSQEKDVLVYEDPDNKEFSFNPIMSDDYRYLILNVWKGTENKSRIYFKDLVEDGEFVHLFDNWDGEYSYIGNEGRTFYFVTNVDAPRERIIAVDIDNPTKDNWVDIIPEKEDVLSFGKIVNRQLVVCYLHNAHNVLKIYNLEGDHVRDVDLPGYISLTGLTGKKEEAWMLIGYTSYLAPSVVASYDFEHGELTGVFQQGNQFNTEGFETTQVFYPSIDGTNIPMFLTYKKGLVLNGENPVLLYGYGGFNVSLTPSFSPAVRMWIEEGGVYAVANLRGGGEFGEEWYKAGTLERKQNVFDDFAAAGEWLIAEGYTKSKKLAIMGGSNGGLLVGASITQRPDLFGAAICQVPVIDMLRYHKFTVGRFWVTDYGNAEKNAEDFAYMVKYSPLHNVREGVEYPPTLITTADTDDRVVPAHAMKFAATLQTAYKGDNPILLRVEKNAGHGLGKPTVKIIEEQTDVYSFLFKTLDIEI
ncbi:prolyl oligopeptidase family serine peptidase [Sporosarcina sp. ACRSL]|uniref:prolyl oligopeptidase family serine peptidase n=1 Tax=Sporosarcina sp. ACRSL TaxID=2918215 RepID=UPI001EF51EDC|nr:prolyl oligopeptidase family serine peptidase [Sporosarcina sp. ACRSL]MCG7344584.1 prolyl oligopeptidase family serine peptidase [Sporosarcina sp. ACRSL]